MPVEGQPVNNLYFEAHSLYLCLCIILGLAAFPLENSYLSMIVAVRVMHIILANRLSLCNLGEKKS